MLTKQQVARAILGLSVAGFTLAFYAAYRETGQERVGVSELEEIRGLSGWRVVVATQDCSQYNAGQINQVGGPPGFPVAVIPVDDCGPNVNGWCIQCDGNATNFSAVQNGVPNQTGMTSVNSMPCGNLTLGHCQLNEDGAYECNDDGTTWDCVDANELWVQANQNNP